MADESTTHEGRKEGTPSKATLQSYIQNFGREAIDAVVEIMRTSRNENLRFGAAKVIVDKSVPDIKAVELTGGTNADGTTEPVRLLINTGHGFIPATIQIPSPPIGTTITIPTEIQSIDLAPQGVENDNSNNGNSQTGTP